MPRRQARFFFSNVQWAHNSSAGGTPPLMRRLIRLRAGCVTVIYQASHDLQNRWFCVRYAPRFPACASSRFGQYKARVLFRMT